MFKQINSKKARYAAHANLIQFALANGLAVYVNDGGEIHKPRQTLHSIEKYVTAVDQGAITVHNAETNTRIGSFFYSFDYGQPPEEIIYDFTLSDFADEWERQYKDHMESFSTRNI